MVSLIVIVTFLGLAFIMTVLMQCLSTSIVSTLISCIPFYALVLAYHLFLPGTVGIGPFLGLLVMLQAVVLMVNVARNIIC